MSNRRNFLKNAGLGSFWLSLAPLVSGTKAWGNTQNPTDPIDKLQESGQFQGKVVLITGATSGIGEATAHAFAKEGAQVFFCGRRIDLGQKVEKAIKAYGGEAKYHYADVRDPKKVKDFVESCVKKYGRIDIAFNNAGIGGERQPFHKTNMHMWEDVMKTNCEGVLHAMRFEIPHMLKQKRGIIINTASTAGSRSGAKLPAYCASKAAVVSLTKTAALEYATQNIRINCISPGVTNTPMLKRSLEAGHVNMNVMKKLQAIQRIAEPEEIAQMVLWLASEKASFAHATDYAIDGGLLAT